MAAGDTTSNFDPSSSSRNEGSEVKIIQAPSPGTQAGPKPEWQVSLDLPNNAKAPDSLRKHVDQELRVLFNMGYKKRHPYGRLRDYIEALRLDVETVGFHRELLLRVQALQLQYWNNGNPIPFQFKTLEQQDLIYSIMWEYKD